MNYVEVSNKLRLISCLDMEYVFVYVLIMLGKFES